MHMTQFSLWTYNTIAIQNQVIFKIQTKKLAISLVSEFTSTGQRRDAHSGAGIMPSLYA